MPIPAIRPASPQTWLVTGASRGLGLEFVRQLAARGDHVIATCRQPAAAMELRRLALATPQQVTVLPLDVTSDASATALAGELLGRPIDVLVCNAGLSGGPRQSLAGFDWERWREVHDVNVQGPLRVLQALLPQLRAGRRRLVAAISSGMGSIGDNTSGGSYAYRSSKAALNMAFKSAAVDLRGEEIAVVVINPGWVRTDMGGANAPLAAEESIAGMLRTLDSVELADSGQFLNYDGGRYPW